MADAGKAAGAKNFQRRTWDEDEYARKAADRAAKEAADEDEIVGPDGRKAPAPYRDAPEGAQGPEGSKRAYLQRREGELDLESKLNTKQLVTDVTPLSQAGGYWCELCQCTLKDSSTYLDHVNGKKHQRRMGMTMRVERVGVDSVKEKLEQLRKQKLTESGALQMDTDDKYAVKAMAVGSKPKAPSDTSAVIGRRPRPDDTPASDGISDAKRPRVEAERPAPSNTTAPPAAKAAAGDDGQEEIDPEMAAMMGFSSFGSTRKR